MLCKTYGINYAQHVPMHQVNYTTVTDNEYFPLSIIENIVLKFENMA